MAADQSSLAILTGLATLLITVIGITNFFRKGGVRQGTETNRLTAVESKTVGHDGDIKSLRDALNSLFATVEVLKDNGRRQEAADHVTSQKLDRLLEGQAEFRARNAKN